MTLKILFVAFYLIWMLFFISFTSTKNVSASSQPKVYQALIPELEQQTSFLCSCTLLFSRVWLISVTLLQSKQTSCRHKRQMLCNQRRLGGDSSKKSGVNCALLLRVVTFFYGLRDVQAEQEWLFPKAFSLSTWCLCLAPLIRRKRVMGGGCTRLDCSQGSPLICTICVCWQCLGCVCPSQSDNLSQNECEVKNPCKAGMGGLTSLWPLWLNQAERLYFSRRSVV